MNPAHASHSGASSRPEDAAAEESLAATEPKRRAPQCRVKASSS